MKHLRYPCAVVCCLLLTVKVWGAEEARLESHLEPLRPLLDQTWKGPFKSSTPEKPAEVKGTSELLRTERFA